MPSQTSNMAANSVERIWLGTHKTLLLRSNGSKQYQWGKERGQPYADTARPMSHHTHTSQSDPITTLYINLHTMILQHLWECSHTFNTLWLVECMYAYMHACTICRVLPMNQYRNVGQYMNRLRFNNREQCQTVVF